MADSKLHIQGRYDIPLREVSGICVYREAGRPSVLVAISDHSGTAVWAEEQAGRLGPWHRVDLAKLSGGVMAAEDTQAEAVAADASGRLFVMLEEPARVVVFDVSGELLLTIDLVVPSANPLAKAWRKRPNSRGEGLALLAGGRLLVAKEKKPPAFIEFGPAGADPLGAGPDRLLGPREIWEPPRGSVVTYEALATWRLEKELARELGDISDLAVTEQHDLYVLSDQSRRIVRMKPLPAPGKGKARPGRIYKIAGDLDKPEGLALLGKDKVLVALDRHQKRDNLYLLGR